MYEEITVGLVSLFIGCGIGALIANSIKKIPDKFTEKGKYKNKILKDQETLLDKLTDGGKRQFVNEGKVIEFFIEGEGKEAKIQSKERDIRQDEKPKNLIDDETKAKKKEKDNKKKPKKKRKKAKKKTNNDQS